MPYGFLSSFYHKLRELSISIPKKDRFRMGIDPFCAKTYFYFPATVSPSISTAGEPNAVIPPKPGSST